MVKCRLEQPSTKKKMMGGLSKDLDKLAFEGSEKASGSADRPVKKARHDYAHPGAGFDNPEGTSEGAMSRIEAIRAVDDAIEKE